MAVLAAAMRIGGWGGESVCETANREIVSFRACERARRGEAVWASERRFDCVARAVVRAVHLLLLSQNHAGWVVHEKC